MPKKTKEESRRDELANEAQAVFAGCGLKLARAEMQLEDLETRLRDLAENCYSLAIKPNFKTCELLVKVKDVGIPPPIIGIIAGEIIHNLRCPLDYLVCARLLLQGVRPNGRNEFPICDNLGDWTHKGAAVNLLGLSPAEVALFDGLQPYKRRNPDKDPLSRLKAMNNADKHRMLASPQYIAHKMGIVNPNVPHELIGHANMTPLKPGKKLFTVRYSNIADFAKTDVQPRLTIDVILRRQFKGETFTSVTSLYRTLQAIRSHIYYEVFAKAEFTAGFEWRDPFKRTVEPASYWLPNSLT